MAPGYHFRLKTRRIRTSRKYQCMVLWTGLRWADSKKQAIRRALGEILEQPSVGILTSPAYPIRPTNENPHEGVGFLVTGWRSKDVAAK